MRVAQKCILTMHIFCVLFLRPFKNAKWILTGQLSWSARSPQKLSVPFERHSTSLARDSSTHFAVSTWARCSIFWKIKRKWISMVLVLSRPRGFWLGSCDQLLAETTRYGRGAGCTRLQVSGASSRVVEHVCLKAIPLNVFLHKTLQINFVTWISGDWCFHVVIAVSKVGQRRYAA